MTVQWFGAAVEAKVRAAAEGGLHDAAEIVSREWQETIPYSSGDLASHVQPQKTGDMEYTISSTGPYARRQELDESFRHPNPDDPRSREDRKAHAGRDALENNRENIKNKVNDAVKAAL